MAAAALVVSILALVISGIAYWRQVKWAKVAARADAEIAQIEQARHAWELSERGRAVLDVRVDPAGTDSHMLVVTNCGADIARDVSLKLTPRAPGKAPDLHNSPFPATIAPRSETSCHVFGGLDTATLVTATLGWTDDAGEQTHNVDLTFG